MIKLQTYKLFESTKSIRRLNHELIWGAELLDIDDVNDIIYGGADVNARLIDGTTALMRCALNKDSYNIAKLLIDKGAILDLMDDNGMTALHWNFDGQKFKTVELLINSGCNTNIKDTKDRYFIEPAYTEEKKIWLGKENIQKMLLIKNPLFIKSFIEYEITLHPNIQKEFAHLISGDELNLI